MKTFRMLNPIMAMIFLIFLGTSTSFGAFLFSENFEGSWPNTWVVGNDGGVAGYTWGDNINRFHGGVWSGFCADNGSNTANTYPDNLHTYMEKRDISLVGFSGAWLSFWYWMNIEWNFDYFTVNVRDQGGTWHEIFRDSGTRGWIYKTLDLSAFAGQSGLYIQFKFDSDMSQYYEGVYLDDISLEAEGSVELPWTYSGFGSVLPMNIEGNWNQSVNATLGGADFYPFIFQFEQEGLATFETTGPSDMVAALYKGTTGELVRYDDDSGTDPHNARVSYWVNAYTPYYFLVSPYGTSTVTTWGFAVDGPPFTSIQDLALDAAGDAAVSGSVPIPYYRSFYRVTAPSNVTGNLTATLTPSGNFNGFLRLLNDAGDTQLAFGNDVNDGAPDVISFNAVTPGQMYYISVEGYTLSSNRTGTYNLLVDFSCATPSVPTVVSPSNGAPGISTTPTLAWNSVSGAASYDVQVCTDTGCASVVRSAIGLVSSQWTVSPALGNGSTYYWRARANNACGAGSWSETWYFTTICPLPGTPSLGSPANGVTGISTTPNLDWGDVSGVSSYEVQVCTDNGCSSVVRSASPSTSQWAVTPALSEGTPYYWRARANNACGAGSWSGAWSFTTTCPTPGVPTLANPSNGATGVSTAPTLDWADVTGASSYDVQGCSDSNCTSVVRSSSALAGSQWAVIPVLSEGTPYYWRARANNACGAGSWSATWNFTTICPTPNAPLLGNPHNGTTGVSASLTLDWGDVSGAISYETQVCSDIGCSTVLRSSGALASSQWVVTPDLGDGTQYYWRARASNPCGAGSWSEVWNFTTVCPIPDAPSLTSPPDGTTGASATTTLNWGDVSGATSYDVQVCFDTACASVVSSAGAMEGSQWTVSPALSDGTRYYWRARANNPCGAGSWTNTWNFTTTCSVQPFPFKDDFSTDKCWRGYEPGGWERKRAKAGGGANGNPDPENDYTGEDDILGFAIGGDYPNNSAEKSIISPPIDCSGASRVFLNFRRWLNVESNEFDFAAIDVSIDGKDWEPVWENPGYDLTDTQWAFVSYDLSAIAAHQPTVYFKFTMGPTNSIRAFSGWNIDDLEVTSESIYPAEGTLGTNVSIWGEGFGTKKGKVLIGGAALKVLTWTDTGIVGTLSKAMPTDLYDVTIITKAKGAPPIVHAKSFSVVAPEIEEIEPGTAKNGDTVTVRGKYFGQKKGKISLSYTEGGTTRGWKCGVTSWSMAADTGDSVATFTVPCGLPPRMLDVSILNSTGMSIKEEILNKGADTEACRPSGGGSICPPDCGGW
jgi:hypothetical protein